MGLLFKSLVNNKLIDPLLSGLRSEILKFAGNPRSVIEIACGTGTLAIDIVRNADRIVAIDLDQDFISYASTRAEKKGLGNVQFIEGDASDLKNYSTDEFDISVTAMSVHQFDADLAVRIISEMGRIAKFTIIGDYNFPLPHNFSGFLANGIEKMAGGDHFRNFKEYIEKGGIKYFTDSAGLNIREVHYKGNGVFIALLCDKAL
ncbi:MAG TPA: class I SAM-dependent methyltransferase [Bacteroidales bacterium]|nr:class I SAM-dependent methyltransferase [Bacteroidales bacterium]